jgi:hypothetical protein
MDINTLQSKIEDCRAKSQYYKSFTDTVTAAYWQGKGDTYEEFLKEEQKEKNVRKTKT